MYFSLFMIGFLTVAAGCGIANAVFAFRNANRDAGWAWFSSTMFALALLLRSIAEFIK